MSECEWPGCGYGMGECIEEGVALLAEPGVRCLRLDSAACACAIWFMTLERCMAAAAALDCGVLAALLLPDVLLLLLIESDW